MFITKKGTNLRVKPSGSIKFPKVTSCAPRPKEAPAPAKKGKVKTEAEPAKEES